MSAAAVIPLALIALAFLSLLEGILVLLDFDAALVLAVAAVVSAVRAIRIVALEVKLVGRQTSE